MKAVLLAGGLGTRLSEETRVRPKPMVEIGGKPILWHIMKIYSHYGINDFIVCLGYKGYIIKEYFFNYYQHTSDLTIDLKNNTVDIHNNYSEPWKITLVDTGDTSMTGGRIARVAKYLEDEENFCLTYGDGLSNIDIGKLTSFHMEHGRAATLTSINPTNRFGILDIDNSNNMVTSFHEKPRDKNIYINGGFFVLKTSALNCIRDGDQTVWEQEPLRELSSAGELRAYKHDGFWYPLDTLRDKNYLENLWNNNNAPWKIWE